jgi:hypothetical protein
MPDSERDPAPTTPPAGIRSVQMPEPVSGFRDDRALAVPNVNDTELSVMSPDPAENPDTLMSLPKPLPHDELPFETRIRQLEDRIETLETRLERAERVASGAGATRGTPWWFWLLFMVGLAVTWRVLGMLR